MKHKDLLAEIVAFEEGEMTEHEQVGFFVRLYNTGVLRGLQGYHQRTFADHVSNGDITFEGDIAVGAY
jgi:hypothetical protein